MEPKGWTQLLQHLLFLMLIAVANSSVRVKRSSDELPHPNTMEIELTLPESNNKLLVPLTKVTAFENIPMTLIENGLSRRFSSRQVQHPSQSHYRDLTSGSVISVRHVNGIRLMSGHVMHEGVSYSVEPIGESEHRIVKKNMSEEELKKKRVMSKKLRNLLNRRNGVIRKKRASERTGYTDTKPTVYEVELHLLLDDTVWDTMREIYNDEARTLIELGFYYSHILTGIDTVYKNIGSTSIKINIVCIGITISKTPSDSKWMPKTSYNDANAILNSVSAYLNTVEDLKGDHVMVFTRNDIHALGMAFGYGVCKKDKRCSLTRDCGLHSWGTAAHELAHNLGSHYHDGEENNCKNTSFIMHPNGLYYSPLNIFQSYRLSKCSISQIENHINYMNLEKSNCLREVSAPTRLDFTSQVREGIRLTLEQVCKLSFPNEKEILMPKFPYGREGQCTYIECANGIGIIHRTNELRAPVGAVCGSGKSCNWNGQCTEDEFAAGNYLDYDDSVTPKPNDHTVTPDEYLMTE